MTTKMQEQDSIGWLSTDLSFEFRSILDDFMINSDERDPIIYRKLHRERYTGTVQAIQGGKKHCGSISILAFLQEYHQGIFCADEASSHHMRCEFLFEVAHEDVRH